MRIALGVLEADAGDVRWAGRPVGREERARFGYMPEERGLYPRMRVGDQLVHFARLHGLDAGAARRAAAETLELVGLADRADTRTEELSLGNQQRAQVAVALVHDPVLLVLDEPFSGLDPIGVEVLGGVLRARAQAGVPVLFSSHQLELVEQLCDDVAILRAGRVVAAGPVEELRLGGVRRYRVDVDGAGEAWVGGVHGATVAHRDAEGIVVAFEGDDQELLEAARRAGAVRRFGPDEQRLADVFREAVAGLSELDPAVAR
jgi:ABC-2 type transport system ATP-binding protein